MLVSDIFHLLSPNVLDKTMSSLYCSTSETKLNFELRRSSGFGEKKYKNQQLLRYSIFRAEICCVCTAYCCEFDENSYQISAPLRPGMKSNWYRIRSTLIERFRAPRRTPLGDCRSDHSARLWLACCRPFSTQDSFRSNWPWGWKTVEWNKWILRHQLFSYNDNKNNRNSKHERIWRPTVSPVELNLYHADCGYYVLCLWIQVGLLGYRYSGLLVVRLFSSSAFLWYDSTSTGRFTNPENKLEEKLFL